MDEAIIAAVELSQRYISDRFLPDKAIDLIDEAFPDVPPSNIIHTLANYPSLKTGIKCTHNYACSAHIDLGLNNCRAGFALTHQYDVRYEKIMNQDTGQEEILELPLVAIDILTSFQAPPDSEIDFSEIRKFLSSCNTHIIRHSSCPNVKYPPEYSWKP